MPPIYSPVDEKGKRYDYIPIMEVPHPHYWAENNPSTSKKVLITLDIGWVILSISSLSFLGLGVQAPTAEWGAMLNEAKNVIQTRPSQMLAPGIAILIVVTIFNLLGDSFRDIFDNKEADE